MDMYPSKHVLPTIYKTREGGLVSENASPVGAGSANSDDMLTLAIRAQGQDNRLKVRKLTTSLESCTMQKLRPVSHVPGSPSRQLSSSQPD